MKTGKLVLISFILLTYVFETSGQDTALLLIDIQDFYFPGGRSALTEPEKAAENAALLLSYFRDRKLPVIFIRHNSEPGGEINGTVEPVAGEMIFSKDEVNCFRGTGLNDYLKSIDTKKLVICGMQTHMCVEAAVRAADDLGYECILIHDACATRDLKYGDKIIKAEDVHYSTLAALKFYSEVISTEEFLKR